MTEIEDLGGGALGRRRRAAQDAAGAEYNAKRLEALHTAALVFQQKSYESATLKDVATALGTHRAKLYRYVSSKDELLCDVVFASVLEIVEDIRRIALTDASAPKKLRESIIRLMTAYEVHYPHLYVFIQEKLDQPNRLDTEWAQELVGIFNELPSRIRDIVEQGVRDGELRGDLPTDVVVNSIFGMINWTHRWYRPGSGRYTGKDIGERFANIFLEGIGQDPAT